MKLLVNVAAVVEHCWSCCGSEEPECEVVKEGEAIEAAEVAKAVEAVETANAIGHYASATCRAVRNYP